jgi:hypothetical protein
MPVTMREYFVYISMSPRMKTASGHIALAIFMGMAELTPKLRAS